MTRQSRLRVQKEKKGRRIVLYLLLVVLASLAVYKVEQHYKVRENLVEQFVSLKNTFSHITPIRGAIYDRNLKQLAVTMERVSVYARTREIGSIELTAVSLAPILSLDPKKLQNKLESGVLRPWIAEDISQDQETAIKDLNLPGIFFQKEEKRYYPNGSKAAHLLGYVEDGIGLSGVEFFYDRLLATRKLQQQEEQKPLSKAQDLVLTVDLKIQTILEDLVESISTNENAEKVAAYLIESETGEIIGGAQYPGFNPNQFTKYDQSQMENIFFSPIFLPDKFRLFLRDCANLYVDFDKKLGPPSWILIEAKKNLGNQLRLWEWLGLGEMVGADFHVPITEKTEDINSLSEVSAKTGSSDFGLIPESATPMSLLTAFSVLLNGGSKKRPFVVKKILDIKTGREVLLNSGEKQAAEDGLFFSHYTDEIRSFFQAQALGGSSKSYFFRDSILLNSNIRNSTRYKINDLTYVTIPAGENDLNMLVVVERFPVGVRNNNKNVELEQILEEKVERLSVLHQVAKTVADVVEPELMSTGNYQGKTRGKTLDDEVGEKVKIQKNDSEVMPDLLGLSLRKSLRLLQGMNIQIHIEGTGRVVKQNPLPGKSVKQVTDCYLILEKRENMNLDVLSKDVIKQSP